MRNASRTGIFLVRPLRKQWTETAPDNDCPRRVHGGENASGRLALPGNGNEAEDVCLSHGFNYKPISQKSKRKNYTDNALSSPRCRQGTQTSTIEAFGFQCKVNNDITIPITFSHLHPTKSSRFAYTY